MSDVETPFRQGGAAPRSSFSSHKFRAKAYLLVASRLPRTLSTELNMSDEITILPSGVRNEHDGRPGANQQTVEWTTPDTAAAQTWHQDAASQHEQFARRWGFSSFVAMLQNSKRVRAAREKHWRLSTLADGRRIMWHERKLVAVESCTAPDKSRGTA
jgi:hypothetical protein